MDSLASVPQGHPYFPQGYLQIKPSSTVCIPPCLEEVQQSTHQRKSFLTSLGAAFQPERPDRPSSNLSHRSHGHRGSLLFTPRFSQHLSEGRLQGRQLRHCRNVLRLVQNSSLCPPFREQSPWPLKCSLPCSRQLTLTDLPSAWLICFSLQPRNTNNQSTCSGIGKILVLLTGERKCSWYLSPGFRESSLSSPYHLSCCKMFP